MQRAEGWNPEIIYRRVMSLPVFQNPAAHQKILNKLDLRLGVAVRETSDHRAFINSLWEELYRSNQQSDSVPQLVDPPSKLAGGMKRRQKRRLRELADVKEQQRNPALRIKTEVLGKKVAKMLKVQKQVTSSSKESKKSCPKCSHLPMEQRCIRILKVKRRKCQHLIGAALTCAPAEDRLQPKPPVRVLFFPEIISKVC